MIERATAADPEAELRRSVDPLQATSIPSPVGEGSQGEKPQTAGVREARPTHAASLAAGKK